MSYRSRLDIATFAQHILGQPLYDYQHHIAQAILASVYAHHGHIFTVMMARQMGKNHLSAILQAYLLTYMPSGTIIKAAPTFTPQITISHSRLLDLLSSSPLRPRLWRSNNRTIGLAPPSALPHTHSGPRVCFYSAAPHSNVMGATADLLLEIDEAQAVTPDKFNRDFRPMASTTNATTVLYGTAWTDDTLLAQQRASNLQAQQDTSHPLHFQYDWTTLAALNPNYNSYVQQEIARLGEDNPSIQTQYLLRPITGAGYLLTPAQHHLLQGTHPWLHQPLDDDWYIAGMDVAGEQLLALPSSSSNQHDSTVISIGRLHYNQLNMPSIDIVHQVCWTNMTHMDQYTATTDLVKHWGIRTLVIDATGLGAGLASMLTSQLGDWRVKPFIFTRPSKSELTYQLLTYLNSGRLKLYTHQHAPTAISQQCLHQLHKARYRIPAPNLLDLYVDPSDGHDDFLISLALLTQASKGSSPPAASFSVRPRPIY